MQGRNRIHESLQYVALVALMSCGGAAAAPAGAPAGAAATTAPGALKAPVWRSEFTQSEEDFEKAVRADFALENHFDSSTSRLRDDDRVDDVTRKIDCRSRSEHLEHLDSVLGAAHFTRAFDGRPGACWTWGRNQNRTSFLATRSWAGDGLPAALYIIRDVVRVCVELRPVGFANECVTTYRSFAVRLLQAEPTSEYVRLESPALANDLGTDLVRMSTEGMNHWGAADH